MEIRPTQRFAIWQAVVFFSVATVFNACKGDDLVGIGIQPEGQFDEIQFTDSFTILTTTRLADAMLSYKKQSYLGEINSPEFGSAQAGLALDFVLGSNATVDNLEDYTIDSCVLHLFPTYFYGDYKNGSDVEIYKLASPLSNQDYYGDFEPSLFGNAITQFSLRTDSLKNLNLDGDTGNVEAFQYRVQLGLKLGQELKNWFQNPSTESFDGLYLKTVPNTYADKGCLYKFSLTTPESRIRLYLTNYDTIPNQKAIVTFPIGTEANRVTTFDFDFENSDLKKSMDSNLVSNSKVYIEGMGGSKAVVKIPGLSTFSQGRDLAISKAVLTFRLDSNQSETFRPDLYNIENPLDQAPRLILLDDDPTLESLTLDILYSTSRHGGSLNTDSLKYSWDVTRTIQKIVDAANNGSDVNYGFTINCSVPVYTDNSWFQMVLLGSKNATLKVYYTDITD